MQNLGMKTFIFRKFVGEIEMAVSLRKL